MSDMEIACMAAMLVQMSGRQFRECADYVEKISSAAGEKAFMENVIRIARAKRKAGG